VRVSFVGSRLNQIAAFGQLEPIAMEFIAVYRGRHRELGPKLPIPGDRECFVLVAHLIRCRHAVAAIGFLRKIAIGEAKISLI
jgi:hypothetical protein